MFKQIKGALTDIEVNQSLQYLAIALNLKTQWDAMLASEEGITEAMRFSYYMLYYYRLLQVHDMDGWGPEELEYLRRHSIEPLDLAGVYLR